MQKLWLSAARTCRQRKSDTWRLNVSNVSHLGSYARQMPSADKLRLRILWRPRRSGGIYLERFLRLQAMGSVEWICGSPNNRPFTTSTLCAQAASVLESRRAPQVGSGEAHPVST
jgi:hypothetical protein